MNGALYCPYCYHRFTARQIMFRCTGRPGPTGRRCESRTDPLLAAHTGDTAPRPPAFEADGRKGSARCECQVETTVRICPFCHSQLPTHFGAADSRLIALVGAKESGKTVFMTVLLHELRNRLGESFGLAVMGADDYTRNQFPADYEDRLYTERQLHESTRTAAGTREGRRPLVFSMTLNRRRAFNRSTIDRSLFSFFDTAGEDLRSADSVERNARYLAAADGIILLLDPLQMRGARPLAEPGTPLPEPGGARDDPAGVLSRVTDLLHDAGRTRRGGRIRKPIAVVFSKLDALDGTLPEDSALLRDSPRDAVYDEADGRAVHEEIRALLDKWQGGGMDLLLEQNFERHRLFGVSALGSNPVRDENDVQRVSEYGVLPRRIQDPFLWLLSEFGTISRRDSPRRAAPDNTAAKRRL
ncbi:hypothetical protein [Actinoplanes sp. NPDC051411]|uniref:TRAFAC clade GTPase domain-containing protein n=1 Tax=Actinoplanes sp. NPDC051411 TaxID=3155522 RepID=UPI0034285A79